MPVNEQQVVTLTYATGGTFTLTFDDTGSNPQTTTPIAFDALAAAVDAALEALSNIPVAGVSVAGSAGGPYTVTFTGALAATNVIQMTADATLLTSDAPAVTVVETVKGVHSDA